MSDGSSTKQVKIARFVVALLIIVGVGAVAGNLIYINWLKKEPAATAMSSSMTLLNIPRPDFTLRDLDGIPRTVSAWDGKVLVINFWATWCKPCLREIPEFNELQNQHRDDGLQFVGIAIDDPKAVKEFVKTTAIDYPILAAEQEGIEVAEKYGNDVGVLPYTAIINRAGNITFVQFGELKKELAQEMIAPLL